MDAKAPINIGVLADALIYYRCTDYDDQVKTVLNEASAWIAARAPGVDKPAIVLDIDETSLSNWEQVVHNKFGYVPSGSCDIKAQSACGQREWELSAQASAIRPTLELFNMAQKLKGKNGEPVDIFFITGRFDDPFERPAARTRMCPDTRPRRASRSRRTTPSSPMSEISRATLSAIRMAIASRSPILSTIFQATWSRAASSNAWRIKASRL
jgi:hypothetical protein